MELDEREANLVQLSSYMRAYTRSTPYCVSARKKASYIERYQDKYEPPQPVIPLYAYIEPFIVLLPEECVVGKAKRKWKAAKRTLDAENPDAAELYGESEDEEDGEEKSKDEDGESIEGEDEENEDDYEFEHFSDDEAGDDDDGPDGTPYFCYWDGGRMRRLNNTTSIF